MDKITLLLFLYFNFLVLLSTTVYSQNINKQNLNIADENLTDYRFLSTLLNQRMILNDDIRFVTEFPCLLGYPVEYYSESNVPLF